MDAFVSEVTNRIKENGQNDELVKLANAFMRVSTLPKYSYNFSWLGRPIIQYPQDILAMQELIWTIKPDLIIETGIAHGGSLIFYASMLELNAACHGPKEAHVLGIDIDIRFHNKEMIEKHPMSKRISMIQGSSVAPETIERVKSKTVNKQKILVCLDSNHTHNHVLAELKAYAPFTSVGSYCVVFDTIIETIPAELYPDRPWGPGNNPMTAVNDYLKTHPEFVIDEDMNNKLLISVSPNGYLRRIK